MKYILIATFIIAYCALAKGQYEDVRCKCVCPSVVLKNGTAQSRKIFVHTFHEPSRCKCENVVDKDIQETTLNFCDRCECQWQRRNTTTIKVVVILIICIVALLFLYMLFLLCLDPLMSRRPKTYLEQQNEEVNLDTQTLHRMTEMDSRPPRSGDVISRVRHEVRRVQGEQRKWKGTVQEQRKNIYDRHTMLN